MKLLLLLFFIAAIVNAGDTPTTTTTTTTAAATPETTPEATEETTEEATPETTPEATVAEDATTTTTTATPAQVAARINELYTEYNITQNVINLEGHVSALNGVVDSIAKCSTYYDICTEDGACIIADAAVDNALTGNGVTERDIAIGGHELAMYYSLFAHVAGDVKDPVLGRSGNNYKFFNLIQCQCEETDGCVWEFANSVTTASTTCIADADCISAWTNAEDFSSGKKAEWIDYASNFGFRYNFPDGEQEDKLLCVINGAVLKEGNAKANMLLSTLTANMANGDEVIETCAKGFAGVLIGGILGTGFGVLFLTLAGSFAYCRWCQNKE